MEEQIINAFFGRPQNRGMRSEFRPFGFGIPGFGGMIGGFGYGNDMFDQMERELSNQSMNPNFHERNSYQGS